MTVRPDGTWPPVYDETGLAEQISRLCSDYGEEYYLAPAQVQGGPDQGDLFYIPTLNEVMYADSDGNITGLPHPSCLWMLIGASCDTDHAGYTLLAPIVSLGLLSTLTPEKVRACKAQEAFRQFYIPPWSADMSAELRVIDLMRIMHVEVALIKSTRSLLIRRLSRAGWILFNGCMVRFLARGDGRESA